MPFVGSVSGGGSSSVAAADITDATATGEALITATDAAAARTAIGASAGAATTTDTFGSLGSWTGTPRGATADTVAATGGVLRLTMAASPTSSSTTDGPRARRTLPTVDGRVVRRFRIRFKIPAIPASNARFSVYLGNGTVGIAVAVLEGLAGWQIYATPSESLLGTATHALAGDGTDWIEIEIGDVIVARHGTGATTPTSWADVTAGDGVVLTPTTCDLYLASVGGSGTHTFDVDDWSFEPLP
jgi:hypothetical protein